MFKKVKLSDLVEKVDGELIKEHFGDDIEFDNIYQLFRVIVQEDGHIFPVNIIVEKDGKYLTVIEGKSYELEIDLDKEIWCSTFTTTFLKQNREEDEASFTVPASTVIDLIKDNNLLIKISKFSLNKRYRTNGMELDPNDSIFHFVTFEENISTYIVIRDDNVVFTGLTIGSSIPVSLIENIEGDKQ